MFYKLSFYVPESHLESVKSALFAQGAGRYAHYDQCCWQVLGEGQFRPLANSQAYIGEIGALTTLAEYKVEMICTADKIKAVSQTLLAVHPYQQVAYEIYPILTIEDLRCVSS